MTALQKALLCYSTEVANAQHERTMHTCLLAMAQVSESQSLPARRRTAGGFFANWASVMLVQMVAQAFGLLIGATVMVPKTAQVCSQGFAGWAYMHCPGLTI